jgi:2-polyprenyl-3-methyl-5-hydroxy-6-metoxy-1,4-benzoquinol methylase
MRTINIVILCILCILCILFIYRFINYNRITNLISLTPHNIDSTNNTSAAVYKFDELYNTTAARGPNDPRVAEQYPQLADQLLLNSAESYPATSGNITAPIRQDGTALVKSIKDIPMESDYENKDISMVADSYNICYMREFPWSHPTDATIKLANIKDKLTILDMGAGTGMVAIYICKRFPNVKIDCIINSKRLFDMIKLNIDKHNMHNQISVYRTDFNTDELPNRKYDRILFLESIGYANNRQLLIQKCYNMLNPNGQIFIKTPSFNNNLSVDNAKELIQIWNYNFSTLDSLLNDAKSTGSNNIKYNSFKLFNNFSSINPNDIINGANYCIKNKINLIRHAYLYVLFINCDIITITN